MNSASGPSQPNDRCHSFVHPRPMMISSLPPPGVAIPSGFRQVPNPMIARPQPQAGALVAGPSPPQPLQQPQGLPQPIPEALQVWSFQTVQKVEVHRQLSLRAQGGQGAQVATLQRRIVELEQEVKRLREEKKRCIRLRSTNRGGDVDSSRSTRPQ